MKTTSTIRETKEILDKVRCKGLSIGFVPTMGELHEGHLELIRRALQDNDYVAVSIFVNPIQFNRQEDYKCYPRNLEKDIKQLEETGSDLLFNPDEKEMYPEPDNTEYDFGRLHEVMEGKFRPGHFNGVAIVVKKLFDIIEPHKAYFGQKDFQQLKIIEALVKKHQLAVKIISCPTIREADGLAMSSRNKLLTPEQRQIAPVIYQTLKKVKEKAFHEPVGEIKMWAVKQIHNYKSFDVEYFEIADYKTLMPVDKMEKGREYIACVAVYLGEVRLIDNEIII